MQNNIFAFIEIKIKASFHWITLIHLCNYLIKNTNNMKEIS